MLYKSGQAFLYREKSVVGNDRSGVVQIQTCEEPMRSVQRVRSVPHPNVHINLVVDSIICMEQMVRTFTRYTSLFPLTQYKISFSVRVELSVGSSKIRKQGKISSFCKSRSRLRALLYSIADKHPCQV